MENKGLLATLGAISIIHIFIGTITLFKGALDKLASLYILAFGLLITLVVLAYNYHKLELKLVKEQMEMKQTREIRE